MTSSIRHARTSPAPVRAPRKRKLYSSPAMSERRERIVACAHVIVGEGGTGALTIARLSRTAGVAPRTIYRLFGDKEGVIHATVADRLRQVRTTIAADKRAYDLPGVFEELDWMVGELRRDALYARVVIGFVFAQQPREESIMELTSVAIHRFRSWLAREVAAGHVDLRLDVDDHTRDHVGNEFVVYHRWAVSGDDERCRLELRSCFLKSAIVLLRGAERERYVDLLVDYQHRLNALAAPPS